MTTLIQLPDAMTSADIRPEDRSRWCCARLEEGNILFFKNTPFDFPREESQFLLEQKQSDAEYHKNIAYRPAQDRLTGFAQRDAQQVEKLRTALRNFSRRVVDFAADLLAPYATRWRIDFASFRPQQEQGRKMRLRARNDLLHVDSFPTRPSNGDRILRIFTNINPHEPRVWITSDTFEALAAQFAGTAAMPFAKGLDSPFKQAFLKLARAAGLSSLARSPYDDWMLRFHHFLKENAEFQRTCPRQRWEFPPGSAWLVFTDMVSHAVLSGQFALEQTFIVSKDTMVLPEKAPVRILERLAGRPLTLPGM
jgi:3-deoxy-D-manno-octulosonic acid hydroxylase-like protein